MGSHSSKKKDYKKHIEFSFGNCLHKLFSLQFIISLAINFMLRQGELSFPFPLSPSLLPCPCPCPCPVHPCSSSLLGTARTRVAETNYWEHFFAQQAGLPSQLPPFLPCSLIPSPAPLFCPQSSHVLRLSLRFVISARCVEQLLEINFTFDSCCRRSPAAPSTPPLSPTLSLHLCLLLLRLHLCTKGTYREWDSHPLPHSFS